MYFTRGIHCSLSFSLTTFILCHSHSDSWDFYFPPPPSTFSLFLPCGLYKKKKENTDSYFHKPICKYWILGLQIGETPWDPFLFFFFWLLVWWILWVYFVFLGVFWSGFFFILFLFLYYRSDFFPTSSYSKFQNFLSCNVFVGFSEWKCVPLKLEFWTEWTTIRLLVCF